MNEVTNMILNVSKALNNMLVYETRALEAETVEDRNYYFKEFEAEVNYIKRHRKLYGELRHKTADELADECPF